MRDWRERPPRAGKTLLTPLAPTPFAGPIAEVVIPARAQGQSADNPADTGTCCSGQLPGGALLVAALSGAASLHLVTLPGPGAAAAASSAARASDGDALLAVHAYRDGLLGVIAQPRGGEGARELRWYRIADLSQSGGAGAATPLALGDVEAADTLPLPGRQEVDCLALGEQRKLGAVLGRRRVALYDLAALE